ncbi:MAG: crossover junction endodeoxyribonuclease RuvC [Flavobacteriales bacterium]|jgi:crossover junction endodeoxyribonuclease RuvC|nr:crossover junction endodeoxyribonuclease RuvC [Flavobacteriales bacterium]
MLAERIIIGIDPGTTVMGFGVIRVRGNAVHLVEAGAERLAGLDDHTSRLHTIFHRVAALIRQHGVHELAIEAQFFGKNVQSMLKLGRAQGVAIAAALQAGLPVVEYAPMRVKQSVTGNGAASKEQVAAMLLHILGVPELPASADATDALAVAVCHHFAAGGTITGTTHRGSGLRKGTSDWGSFVRNNPGRIKGS